MKLARLFASAFIPSSTSAASLISAGLSSSDEARVADATVAYGYLFAQNPALAADRGTRPSASNAAADAPATALTATLASADQHDAHDDESASSSSAPSAGASTSSGRAPSAQSRDAYL